MLKTSFPKYILLVISFLSQVIWGQSAYNNLYEQLEKEEYNNWWHPITPDSPSYTINISSQTAFDKIGTHLNEALRDGHKNIKVVFSKGPFYFNDEHIVLSSRTYKDVIIKFVGNDTQLIPAGKYYKKGDVYRGNFSVKNVYLDSRLKDLNIWGQMYHSDAMVDIIDENNKICRIHCPDFSLPSESVSDETYLQLTEWYMTGIYKVIKVDGNYVFFIADDLNPALPAYGNYNVNYDYTVAKIFPRFRVCNLDDGTAGVNLHKGKPVEKDFYEGTAYTFFKLYGAVLKYLEVSGIKIYGNAGRGMLFNLRGANIEKGIYIHDCEFRNIKSVAVYMMQTSNVVITDNVFEDCYSDVILSISHVNNTIVIANTFQNVGKELSSSFAIRCQSSNFYISNNIIIDFGLGGIGVGNGRSDDDVPGSGIIEDNVLFYTDSYHHWCSTNSLIDGGAIYLFTRHDGTTIRFNRIHNYTGRDSNRGIYCDNGAYGFSIYGNVITNITNYNYIDSRLVPSSKYPTNTNNMVLYNIIEGRYQFVGRPEANNGCVKGQNIILTKKGEESPTFVLGNFDNPEDDVFLEYKENKDLVIKVPRSTRRQLKKLPFYRRIKKYFKV